MTKNESKTIKKNKGGRPTKYNEEMVKKAYEYIELAGNNYEELPTLFKMAEYLKVDEDTVLAWGKKYDEFIGAIKKVKKLQRDRLMGKGLDNTWNSPMAMFLLKCNHGFVDRVVNINVESPESKVESLLEKMGE